MSKNLKIFIILALGLYFFSGSVVLAYWDCAGEMTTTWEQDTSGCDQFGENCSYYGPWYETEVCNGSWVWVDDAPPYQDPYTYPSPIPGYSDPYGTPGDLYVDPYPTPEFGALGTYDTPTNPNWPASGPPCGESGFNYAEGYYNCSGGDDPYSTPAAGYTTPNLYPSPIGGAFNYSLSNSGTSNATKSSGNVFTQNTITKTLLAGSTQPITIAIDGTPAGTSYSISPNSCSPNCSSTITFTVSPSTVRGNYLITVTGSQLGKQTSFLLRIFDANNVTVTCTPSLATVRVGQNVTWTGTVTGAGTPPYTYSWSGTSIPSGPAPSTNPYTRSYNTTGQKNAVLTVTDANDISTSCVAGVVRVNFSPEFEEF